MTKVYKLTTVKRKVRGRVVGSMYYLVSILVMMGIEGRGRTCVRCRRVEVSASRRAC